MKRLTLTSLACLVLLAACSRSTADTLIYSATYKTDDAARRLQLGESLEKVINRRLEARGISGVVTSVTPKGKGGEVMISNIASPEKRGAIVELLAESFTFDLRLEKTSTGQTVKSSSSASNLENWEKTDITGADLVWVQAQQDPKTQQVGIELTFTEKGREKLSEIFAKHNNRVLGIFVRDFLVSKLTIDGKEIKKYIVITGVPNVNVAQVFADDVNVGIVTSLSLQ